MRSFGEGGEREKKRGLSLTVQQHGEVGREEGEKEAKESEENQ